MTWFKRIKNLVLLCALMTTSFVKSTNLSSPINKTPTTLPQKLPSAVDALQSPRVTVWLHGTKSFGLISDFIHATPTQGLIHAKELPKSYRLHHTIATLSATDPVKFPLEHFYTFGWSGKLSFNSRKETAQELYNALKNLSKRYTEEHGITPEITLITHSHGGNVALNLAKVQDPDNQLKVEAILLACPVQSETQELVKDPLFKKIYSFYSRKDWMQVLDPQGFYLTDNNLRRHWKFSEREFPAHHNLYQAELTINNSGINHAGFLSQEFIALLPMLVDGSEEWKQSRPSHNKKQKKILALIR
ncbi:MAG: alpha/beta hydrolase fold domain-containing protein [Candidatus Dependentiae bacterium]|nr:alpha/beta hydrolase fold domain-containing protein [Candidatus Dependentiae bacterium]